MTSPETPHETSNDAAPPHVEVAHAPSAPGSAGAESSHAPQESNDAPSASAATAESSEGEGEGPAPGNERGPIVRVMNNEAGAPTGAKRRRRRKKRGGGGSVAPGAAGAAGATGEGGEAHEGDGAAAEGAEGATGESGQPGEHAAGEHKGHGREGREPRDKKRPRPPRPDRERPAFSIGDVTFGKILEITEDVIMIDLLGKGHAIFDLRELLLPIDDEPGAPEPEEHDDEKDEAETAVEDLPTATSAPEDFTAAPATEIATPGAEAATPSEAVAEAEVSPEAADAAPPATEGATEAATDASTATSTEEKPKHVDPPLPQVILEVGAQFVGVVHNDGGRGGLFVLTHHPRRASKAKPIVAAALKDHTLVQGIVTGVIKGGVEADVDGLRAFVPGSHMDLHLGADLSRYVGKRLDFYVTQYGKRGRDVVLSRKPLLEAEAKQARELALKTLTVGAVVEGTVRSVVAFGAFVDVGGVEGLVELKEMSHNRSDAPGDVFKAGEKVEVKVLRIDDRGKVWLSRKACIPDPWGDVAKKYAVGTKHMGKVVRIQPFGAFVELENGIDGLIHFIDFVIPTANGIAGIKKVESINELVKVGDEFEVVVAHIESGTHKIGLHPALTGPLADEAPQKVQQYKPAKAVVVLAEAGGLLVRILGVTGRNARGYITSAATGTPRGTELRKPFPVGTQVEAKVIEVDPKRGEAKLSIKALNEESERNAFNTYRAQVKSAARFTLGDLLAKKK